MANVVTMLFKPLGGHLCLIDRDIDILEGTVPIKKEMHYGIKATAEINTLSAQSFTGPQRNAGV